MLYDAYSQTFSKVADEAVLTDNLVVATKVSSLTNGLLNVVSLSRYVFPAPYEMHGYVIYCPCSMCSGQIHSKVDRMCDIIFAFAVIVLCALLWLSKMQIKRLESKVENRAEVWQCSDNGNSDHDSEEKEKEGAESTDLEAIYKEIAHVVQPQVLACRI